MTKFKIFECKICGEQAKTFSLSGDYTHQDCPRCGESGILETPTFDLHIDKQNAHKDHEVWVVFVKLSGPGILKRANLFL